jgi:hypothetical protein
MAKVFTITTATNTTHLSDERRGEAAFTVFNASGRAIRGRARLVAEDPVAQEWLALAGEAEREFAIADAQQYTAQIAVPPDAPVGSNVFRLDMVGVENPDRDYVQGPTVTFVVPEPQPQEQSFPWWIVAVVAGALLVLGIVLAIIFWPRGVTVPEVAEMTAEQATDELEGAGLVVADDLEQEPHDTIPEGRVILTEPPAGVEVSRGAEVMLVVSSGILTVQVPDVVGMTVEQATAELQSAGLGVNAAQEERPDENIARGSVIATDPAANTAVRSGSQVTLIVSAGQAVIRHFFTLARGGLDPDLAQSWELSDDGQLFTLHLTRESVQLANGQPFNAESAGQALSRTLGSAGMEGIIEDATVIDDRTLRLTLGPRAMDQVSVNPFGFFDLYILRLTQLEFETLE